MNYDILQGDCLETMRSLPSGIVQTCITSPPYYGLRAYLHNEHDDKHLEVGTEETPEAYVAKLVEVFREVRRLLRDDGTLWLNLGDSYNGSGGAGGDYGVGGLKEGQPKYPGRNVNGLGSKQLLGIPWRVAFALQADGWILRSDIIWHKCLSGGAVVYAKTQKGEMPMMIKDLVRLDPANVQLWDGEKWNQCLEWHEVAGDPERQRKSALARAAKYRGKPIEVQGDIEIELRSGERIGCTREHRWPTQRGLVCASELQIGDVIDSVKLPTPTNRRTPSALNDYLVGWFVGLYIAEGSMSNGTIQIASHSREQERFDRLATLAESFDGYLSIQRNKGNAVSANINSPILSGIIETYVSGLLASGKHLHSRCWKRGNDFLTAVLEGYLSGDGHNRDNGRWILAFCQNDQLAQDLRTLCARIGASIRLKRTKHQMNGREFDGWRGSLYFDANRRHNPDSQIVAIRQSRARKFYDIVLAENPHLFALASGVLTHNSNPMPESVTDRPTKSHEYIFLLSKSREYFYDADAIREEYAPLSGGSYKSYMSRGLKATGNAETCKKEKPHAGFGINVAAGGRNKRSVWTVTTKPYSGAHFATFPPDLIEPCILAGSSSYGCCAKCGSPWVRVVEREMLPLRTVKTNGPIGVHGLLGGNRFDEPIKTTTTGWEPTCTCNADVVPCTVLDPFNGSGTTGAVSLKHGRKYIGCELNEDYITLSHRRIQQSQPMLLQVTP